MNVDTDMMYKRLVSILMEKYPLEGKTILDLGCGNGAMVRMIAKTCAPRQIIGLDFNIKSPIQGENFCIMGGDARAVPFDDNTFDFVYSIATFEHMHDIPIVLSEIKRTLKPRGKFYTRFCPLWTSVVGHHCYSYSGAFTKGFSGDREDRLVWSIPAWGHLYMSKDEVSAHLKEQQFEDNQIERITKFIYESEDLNRYPASVIRHHILHTGMIVRSYSENVAFSRKWALNLKGESELNSDIIQNISKSKYDINDIAIMTQIAELEKYESIVL